MFLANELTRTQEARVRLLQIARDCVDPEGWTRCCALLRHSQPIPDRYMQMFVWALASAYPTADSTEALVLDNLHVAIYETIFGSWREIVSQDTVHPVREIALTVIAEATDRIERRLAQLVAEALA